MCLSTLFPSDVTNIIVNKSLNVIIINGSFVELVLP